MADQAQSALGFTIQVLEGELASTNLQAGQPNGRIVLEGRQMPYRSFSFERKQRVKTRFYNGNPIGTQQVLGPTHEPSVFTGTWKDVFLGDGAAIALVHLFETLTDRGLLVEVSWGSSVLASATGTSIGPAKGYVRRGILTRFKSTPERIQDIAWEMEFAWRGDDQLALSPLSTTDIVTSREGALDAVSAFNDASNIAQAFQELMTTRLFKLPAQLAQQIDQATAQFAEAANGIASASSTFTSFVNIPQDGVARLVASYSTALAAARQLRDTTLAIPQYKLVAWDDAKELLMLQVQLLIVLSHADLVADIALRGRDAAQAQLVPTVIAEERPAPGSDLRDLARRYYGNADLWTAIARFNGLTTSAVPPLPAGPSDNPGPPIRIPRQDVSSSIFDPHLGC